VVSFDTPPVTPIDHVTVAEHEVTLMNADQSIPLAAHLRHICGEYLEMPGLRLTAAQAQRLLGLEPRVCMEALSFLVNSGFLYVTSNNQYARLTEGTIPSARLRMVKLGLERRRSERRLAG
jgi:hypothetical protein